MLRILIFFFLILSICSNAQTVDSSHAHMPDSTAIEEAPDEDSIEFYHSGKLNIFHGTVDDAFSLAKKEKKGVLLVFGAKWCLPCLQMNKYAFNDDYTAATLNRNFIILKLDVDNFNDMEVADKYKIIKYPTLLFFAEKGKSTRVTGYQTDKELISIINKLKS